MSRTNQILAAALVAQLALIAWVWSSGDDRSLPRLEELTAIESDAVTRLEIYDRLEKAPEAEPEPAVVLEKSAEGWVLASHHGYPADETKVADFLDKLAGMKSRGPVATQASRHRQLRVAPERYDRKLVVHRGGGEPLTIYLGTSAGRGKGAVRIEGEDATHGVAGINAYAAGETARRWVDEAYFENPDTPIASLVIENAAGRFELEKGEAGWKRVSGESEVAAPPGKELDAQKIDALAAKLETVRLAEPADPAKKGFSPVATVTFAKADGSGRHELRIGAKEEERHLVAVDDRRPVWVEPVAVKDLVELSEESLYREPGAEPAAPGPGALPGGMPPPGEPLPVVP